MSSTRPGRFSMPPGRPWPLGATLRDGGVNFAVFSAHASAIDVCVFDAEGTHERARHRLVACADHIWHGFLPGAGPGLVYGLRAHGPFAPAQGHRFNHHKLLLDPYAREIVGRFEWRDEDYAFSVGHPDGDRAFDRRDNAATMLKARVAAPLPPPPGPRPRHALIDSVLYEVHVKGFTRQLEAVPAPLRGTFAGLAHPAAIAHLQRLGVTTVSLMPVHYGIDERRLVAMGLANYWNYNSLGFFALDRRLSATPDDPTATRAEFRAMVGALHAAGFEVHLDVVYNHTCEGDEGGPSLSWRGLDHASYYRLQGGVCENFTGCGNTVNVAHPRVAQMVLDSLRYWAHEMGIDGFRFDIATVLGRAHPDFDPGAPFFFALRQDPTLAGVKLIAEPWDVGPHGYQLGRFPPPWSEWNDRFRDVARLYWLSRGADRGEFARRVAASSDKFHHGTRLPSASVNFVAVHDGFTLADVVSYNHRHNHENGEYNRDGHHANFSANCGVEGPSTDPKIVAQRRRLQRALLATAVFAQGTPLLSAGDELGRTQRGNNNAYCQDNAIGWLDWKSADHDLIAYTAALIALRRRLPALRQDRWMRDAVRADGRHDVEWLAPQGRTMTIADWHDTTRHCFGQLLAPPLAPPLASPLAPPLAPPPESGTGAAPVLVIFNPEPEPVQFVLPRGPWVRMLDSARADVGVVAIDTPAVEVPSCGVILLTGEVPRQ